MLSFVRPEWLWLLAVVPIFIFVRRRSRSSPNRFRATMIVLLRCVMVALLAVSMAQPVLRKPSDMVTTYFLLDRSASIPEELKAQSLQQVRQMVASKQRREDRAGVIVFGSRPSVEESPSAWLKVGDVFSVIDPANSDLGAAVKLALSTFPDDSQKRIVLFSDGNETKGSLIEAARRAAGSRCPIDIVPLQYEYRNEVLVEELTLPRKVQKDEPFQMRIDVRSLGAAAGVLRLYCDGGIIGSRDVNLAAGDNIFVFSHALRDAGFHLFEAQIDSASDSLPQNNKAQAYTIIEDESMVLLAGGTQEDVRYLDAALTAEKVPHRTCVAGELPRDLGEWQSYDLIAFANLGAENLSPEQMTMIETMVRDLGAGFMMLGGEKSFGAGGWFNTPIAHILPVDLDVSQNQILPNGGVVFMIDHIHCIGDRWSKDVAMGVLNPLTRWDEFGVLIGGAPDKWTVPLQAVTDKKSIQQEIDNCSPWDIADVDVYLQRVIDGFRGRRIGYRHAILITDGSISVPSGEMLDRLRENKISLTIVVIEPRGGNNGELQKAAKLTGGNFYVVQPSEHERIPQISMRESTRVKKGLYFEEKFKPQLTGPSEILEGIGNDDLPPLHGYNVTSRRDPTEVPMRSNHSDAVLANWNCGLGRVIAFTSDMSGRWGQEWIGWPRFSQFWSQAVRWARRRIPVSPYQLAIQKGRVEGTADVFVDAVDGKGRFVNFLNPTGTLLKPGLETEGLKFQQVGPGRYKATFPTDKAGGYVANVRYVEGGQDFLMRAGHVPSASVEYRRFTHNAPLLAAVAEETRGRFLAPGQDPFAPTGERTYSSHPVWPLLILLALCLLPLDIFVRRVIIGFRDITSMIARRGKAIVDPVQEALARARAALATADQPAWTAPAAAKEVGSAAPGHVVEEAQEEAPAESELTARLKGAKDRARKKFEK